MNKAKRVFSILMLSISIIGIAPVVASAKPPVGSQVADQSTAEGRADVSNYDIRQLSSPRKHAYPTLDFWEKLAQCETAQDWENGGRYAGGLGIMTNSTFPKSNMGTWERFGGEEFAPSPDKATREEQITVANRIAIGGYRTLVNRDKKWAKIHGVPAQYIWDQEAVGLNGWGCYKSKSTGEYRMSKPKMYYYENYEDVIYFRFVVGERSKAAHDLQVFLGITVDHWYGPKTMKAHKAYIKKHAIRTYGTPVSSGVVSAQSVSLNNQSGVVKKCPKWEKLIRKYELPVKEFSYIMWRESRCQASAIGWNYKSGKGYWSCKRAAASKYKQCAAVASYDSGLLQINSTWTTVTASVCKSEWGDMTVLLNPQCNLAVAKYLYENGGMLHWKSTSGRYSG